jgi:hypothetical protein
MWNCTAHATYWDIATLVSLQCQYHYGHFHSAPGHAMGQVMADEQIQAGVGHECRVGHRLLPTL